MLKFELIRYTQFPEDLYTSAIAMVRIDGKHIVTFANKKLKDGGNFWASPSAGITLNGEKKHYAGYFLDSRAEEELLLEFIRDSVKAYKPMVATSNSLQATGQMQYAQQAQQSQPQVQAQNVENNDQLPF